MPAWRTRTTNASTCGRSTAVRHTFASGCPAEYGRGMTPSTSGDSSGKGYPQKHRGPVTLRRAQVQRSTTDQRLLDSVGTSEWLHTDPWRVQRMTAEFVEGFGALAELPKAVSVFGSARTPTTHPDYARGERLGANLRSEEHTSELQSRGHLVCRLLLEKKKD